MSKTQRRVDVSDHVPVNRDPNSCSVDLQPAVADDLLIVSTFRSQRYLATDDDDNMPVVAYSCTVSEFLMSRHHHARASCTTNLAIVECAMSCMLAR